MALKTGAYEIKRYRRGCFVEGNAPFLGKHFTEKHKQALKIAKLKNWQDEDYREHMSKVHKDKKATDKTKLKMSISQKRNPKIKRTQFIKGQTAWNEGLTKNNDKRMRQTSISLKGKRNGKKTEFGEGLEHWNWKGGITSLRIKIRNSDKYKKWRFDVYCRDNFICQDCGCEGKELNAHHIISFEQIMKENNIIDLEQAILCKELWNINNGITLCKECHDKMKVEEVA